MVRGMRMLVRVWMEIFNASSSVVEISSRDPSDRILGPSSSSVKKSFCNFDRVNLRTKVEGKREED
ncbi:unnamed protein product [Dovyalis caffra]|uniref:Uncharacterized protein n=1 Tax=Dovyalis caffra TaxID=77055 RepID=A0AAV1RNX0_9ROSI|nr:unnamed protein product [Dovyalis caffra]